MKKENGVTVIAVVVTVIVMVVLVGTTLNYILGENNIMKMATGVSVENDKEKVDLILSDVLLNFNSEQGYKGRGAGIDTYLIDEQYIKSTPAFYTEDAKTGEYSIFYKINIDVLIDGPLETGHGLAEKYLETEEDLLKDFYYVEIQQADDMTAKLNLRYIDKDGNGYRNYEELDEPESKEDKAIHEYEEAYNMDLTEASLKLFVDDKDKIVSDIEVDIAWIKNKLNINTELDEDEKEKVQASINVIENKLKLVKQNYEDKMNEIKSIESEIKDLKDLFD